MGKPEAEDRAFDELVGAVGERDVDERGERTLGTG
jgi:hypothetical protein